jgi:DNA-binding NtrC family response regulator
MKVLIVEDEKITRITLANLLEKEGYEVDSAATGDAGYKKVSQVKYDVVITDLRLPGKGGIDILKTAREKNPGTDVIVMTAYATVETAVSALKLGAYDYITKPLSPEKFLSLMKNVHELRQIRLENEELRERLEKLENRSVIGSSEVMRKLMDTVANISRHDYSVLLQGESGTGKEVIARAIHQQSDRRKKPFIAINCASIPETLLESELFGHEKGSFSGAIQQHIGYFERADQGTLFIDDIDDFPFHMQVKLLRMLQERQIVRVGGSQTINVDVRVICATKVDLHKMVREGTFREDLYYRIHIIPVELPPLRQRLDDIPALTRHFFDKHGAGRMLEQLQPSFFENLMRYNWPGNVRQLENTVERIIATGDLDIPRMLVSSMSENPSAGFAHYTSGAGSADASYPPFEEFIRSKEEEIIRWALESTDHNISRTADLLSLPRGTLRSKLKKMGLS